MKEIIDFLRETTKLREMPRRGWVINQIDDPESIAEHLYRATVMAWVLGKEKNLNTYYLMKIALVHDLCEVYAGDTTPYDSVLPEDKEELEKLMETWPRFSQEEKEKNSLDKHEKEKKGLEDLTVNLPESLKKEMISLWMDYENRVNEEGRFFSQADRMENFIQAYEYWEKLEKPPLEPWWLWAREFFDDPLLLEFMDALEIRFHERSVSDEIRKTYNLLNFFIEVGKLKRNSYKPNISIAEHSYQLALLTLILKKDRSDFDIEKALKISLVHGFHQIEEVTENLEEELRGEIRELFNEYIKKDTTEGVFINEAIYVLGQIEDCQREDAEDVTDSDLLELLKEVRKNA